MFIFRSLKQYHFSCSLSIFYFQFSCDISILNLYFSKMKKRCILNTPFTLLFCCCSIYCNHSRTTFCCIFSRVCISYKELAAVLLFSYFTFTNTLSPSFRSISLLVSFTLSWLVVLIPICGSICVVASTQ